MTVAIVDYGVGNLGSVGRALARLGRSFELTSSPDRIRGARHVILPGVGHFGESMANLRERGLEAPLREALDRGASLLGICVGFQMLFERSEEAPGA
ncbi:MAG TPA: imidazole glycerol phosphate synthase subunit HisH, partial [Vicinamibacteria bacterium]|nr:imidazole glycerol phosphate synthase subunit HisH [Vicinamibacteria bacterium]